MENTLNNKAMRSEDLYFYRQRYKNHVFQTVMALFVKRAKSEGLTKKQLAARLKKDPAQITRWFSGPGNMTLDKVSDLLLAMDAEPTIGVCDFQETDTAADNEKFKFSIAAQTTETTHNGRIKTEDFQIAHNG